MLPYFDNDRAGLKQGTIRTGEQVARTEHGKERLDRRAVVGSNLALCVVGVCWEAVAVQHRHGQVFLELTQ